MNRFAPAALALALLAGVPAFAAPTTYVIDGAHTFPRFSYSHFGYSTQLSRFNRTSGQVVFDPVARTGSVEITIDMTSVDTGSDTFDEHIQAADFLDTKRHPTATFRSTKVKFDGDRPAAIEGLLTIRGITKPVTLTVTSFKAMEHPMLKKPALGADAHTVVRRSEFGAGKYAPAVGDEVRIDVALEAVAKQP
jgi:polyisoprenoid-binding protein YceI